MAAGTRTSTRRGNGASRPDYRDTNESDDESGSDLSEEYRPTPGGSSGAGRSASGHGGRERSRGMSQERGRGGQANRVTFADDDDSEDQQNNNVLNEDFEIEVASNWYESMFGSDGENPHEDGPDFSRGMIFNEELGEFVLDKESTDNPSDVPKANEWEKTHARNMTSAKVTFDSARSIMMTQLVAEYDALRNRLEELGIDTNEVGLFQRLFGEKSRFAQVMMRELELDYSKFCTFMATFYRGAQLGLPVKRLEEDDEVIFDGYMDENARNQIWNKIASVGQGGGQQYLWHQIQGALNEDCRSLFLSGKGRVPRIRVAWDDDKLHFQFSTAAVRSDPDYLCGLSPQQHVKANCRGFTLDTCASAAAGFLYCVSAIRQGMSNTDNYIEMITFMFSYFFSNSALRATALFGIIFCSDRGYWNPALILTILSFGGTVFGTLKRMSWLPYTYDQKPSAKDMRDKIDKNKGRSLFTAFSRMGKKLLKVLAWRSGTGAVSLAMTSDCKIDEVPEFDFNFKNSGDSVWYHSRNLSDVERNRKAFSRPGGVDPKHIDEETASGINYYLTTLGVTMLTCKDLGIEWFTLRMFRLTSSSTWASLSSSVPFVPVDHSVRPAVESVANYCGLEGRLVDDEDAGDLDSTEMGESQIDSETIAWMVKAMRLPTQSTANACAKAARRIKDALDSNNISSPVIEKMMLELGFSRERASCERNLNEAARAKKLKTFLDSVICMEEEIHSEDSDSETDSSAEVLEYDFPYDILSANEVQTELIRRVGNTAFLSGDVPGPYSKPKVVAEKRATLLFLDRKPVDRVDGQDDDSSNLDNLRAAITNGIIRRSFLRGLAGEEKGAAKVGHQNEPKYLAQYYNDGREGLVPGVDHLVDVLQPGLAVQEGRQYVGDSADGIAIERHLDDDDDLDGIGYRSHLIECKCRVGTSNLQEACEIRNRAAEIKGGTARLDVEQNKAVYLEVSSSSPFLSEVIPSTKERVQVLHHAFTYKNDRTALLVGDPHGNIMYGLIITFDSKLLDDYGKVLDFMYENGLDKFYSNNLEDLPKKFIEEVLETDTTLKKKYDMDDFMTSFLIWRELRLDGLNPPNFPIPQCDMLIPLLHALWNASKGGSDTMTRLAWNCLAILGIKTPQTVVVARLFMLYAALLHRMNQAITGRKKPDVATDTIKTVRDRNNKRFAFHESLRSLKDLLKNAANRRNAEETVDCTNVASHRPTRVLAERWSEKNASTRHDINDSALERVGTTGATPFGRGKSKESSRNLPGFGVFKQRCDNCVGVPTKIMDSKTDENGEPSGFQLSKRKCDLCGMRTSTMCIGCKRVFCLDNDRTNKLKDLLRDDVEGARIRRDFPALADVKRGDAPSSVCRIGMINNDPIYAVQSCFHFAHRNYFDQCIVPAVDTEASSFSTPRRR